MNKQESINKLNEIISALNNLQKLLNQGRTVRGFLNNAITQLEFAKHTIDVTKEETK